LAGELRYFGHGREGENGLGREKRLRQGSVD
jgi:hypothetical protein